MQFLTVSMMCRILVIISPATLTTPVGHPLGEEKEICKNFTIPSTKEKTP
jgi:hypothetical protein